MILVLAQARWLAIIVLRRDSATSITDEVIQWAILPSYARTCGIQTTGEGQQMLCTAVGSPSTTTATIRFPLAAITC